LNLTPGKKIFLFFCLLPNFSHLLYINELTPLALTYSRDAKID
jgi:hypothetical protein